jgi:hypothetical protein
VALLPAFTLPKFTLAGENARVCEAATPVADNGTVAGLFGALLTIETVPLALPAACGAYCTVRLPLWPGVNVSGKVSPLPLNPVPVTVACEITRFAVPLFLSCTVCEPVFPVITDPKLALPGVAVNPACTPVPVTAETAFTPSALVTETPPVTAPLVVGANCAVSVTLCEGARVSGTVTPLTEIPVPLAATCVTVTLEFPVLDNTTFCVALLPAFTFPKFRLAGDNDIV